MTPASLERRCLAVLVDGGLAWGAALLAATAARRSGATGGGVVAVVVGTLLLAVLADAVLVHLRGGGAGAWVASLRVVRVGGGPVPLPTALARRLLVASAGVPTAGLGLVALAWTALGDPAGARRGVHDRLLGTVVVEAAAPPLDERPPAGLVNLTAARLAVPAPVPSPAPSPVPSPAPSRVPSPVGGDGGTPVRRVEPGWSLVDPGGTARPVRGLVRCGTAQVDVAPDGALVVVERDRAAPSALARGAVRRELPPGRPVTLLDGDVLHLGAGTVRVRRG